MVNLRFGKVRIRGKQLVGIIFYLTLFMGFLIDDMRLPSAIRFLNDFIVLALLIMLIKEPQLFGRLTAYGAGSVLIAMVCYTIVNIVSVILNRVPLNLVLWATRNTYRFFVFFIGCIIYLDAEDIEKTFSRLYRIQWFNLLTVMYQFFVLGLKQDFLGGIFGHGGNAGLLIYSVLLLGYAMTKYIRREYTVKQFLFIFLSTSLISVLAEIRVFFVIVILTLGINFVFNVSRRGWVRKAGIALVGVALFLIAVEIYAALFPYVELSFAALFKEGNSTGGGYNISRLGAFGDINDIFFHGDIYKNLLGLGFGNCEYSSISIFNSAFYERYGHLNYRWFTHQWIFLESGYLGILSYLSIIVAVFIASWKQRKKTSVPLKSLNLVPMIMSMTCGVMFIYNSLLKADYGYIAFWGLAIAFVLIKTEKMRKIIEK